MDEHIKDAIRHERELREQEIEQLEKCFSNMRDHHAKSLKEINEKLKSISKWDKFKSVGFVLVGILLSSSPESIPFLKLVLK